MPDIDDLLEADARGWRTDLAEPPDLAESLRRALSRLPRRRRTAVWLSVAAVVLIAVAAAIGFDVRHSHTPAGGGTSTPPNPGSLVDAGTVPWADPVVEAAQSDVVHVLADNDKVRGGTFVCGVARDVPRVRETSSTVTIEIRGFGHRLPPNTSCAGIGHFPVDVVVRLKHPLAGRRLIDVSDGAAHPLLDASTVPHPRDVPPTCRPESPRIDARSHVITWAWHGNSSTMCTITFEYAPLSSVNTPNTVPHTVEVGGLNASQWDYESTGTAHSTIGWSPTANWYYLLTVTSEARHPITPARALTIARSVR